MVAATAAPVATVVKVVATRVVVVTADRVVPAATVARAVATKAEAATRADRVAVSDFREDHHQSRALTVSRRRPAGWLPGRWRLRW